LRIDVEKYIGNVRSGRKLRHRVTAFLTAMSMAVSMAVFWQLRGVGTAMEDTQVCAQQEHSHTDKCCERVLVCGQDTDGGHEHRDECYESRLICGLEEHTHSEGCKPDEGADVENEKIWEATLPKELAGDVRENVALVAASQLGYSESQRNFHFSYDAKTKNAYSRYGQWYGSPYSRWNSLFTYFCMYYAGVDKQCVPYGSGIAAWTAELEKKELLNSLGDSKPQRGDILFIDTDLDEKVDRSAVVCEVTEKDGKATAETIEGDVEGKVAKGSYQLTDKHITGFVSLENADGSLSFEQTSKSGIKVKAKAAKGVFPNKTTMTVTDIEKSEAVKTAQQGIGTAEKVVDAVAVDITFKDAEGREIEPADSKNVKVQISLTGEKKLEGDNQKLLHKTDNGEVKAVENAEMTETEASFTAESFSIYVWTVYQESEVSDSNQPRYVDISKAAAGNSQSNPYVINVGESINIASPGSTSGSFAVYGNGSGDTAILVRESTNGADHNIEYDGSPARAASYVGHYPGTCSIHYSTTGSADDVFWVKVVKPVMYVNTSIGPIEKDRVHEYLSTAVGNHDGKNEYIYVMGSDGNPVPAYVKNNGSDEGKYMILPGDTFELVSYVPKQSSGDYYHPSSEITRIGNETVEDLSDGTVKVTALFKANETELNENGWNALVKVGSTDSVDTTFFVWVRSSQSTKNGATHSDIEISDGGTYTVTKTVTDSSNNTTTTVIKYQAVISDINHCYIYDKNNEIIGTFLPDDYTPHGTLGETQYELTSQEKCQGNEAKHYRRQDAHHAEFDVELYLNPIGKTVNGIDAALTEEESKPITIEKAVFQMDNRSLIDAYNKCPNHSGLDFTLKANLNEMIKETPAQIQMQAKKVLNNQTIANEQFGFELYNNDREKIAEARNDADGNVVFPEQMYIAEGNYTYFIKEVIPAGDTAYEYDNTEFKAVVTVTKNGNTLTASVNYYKGETEVTKPEFVNTLKTYTLPNTGGCGVIPHICIGTGLICAAGILLWRKKRREL